MYISSFQKTKPKSRRLNKVLKIERKSRKAGKAEKPKVK